jgi:hypothetical protein
MMGVFIRKLPHSKEMTLLSRFRGSLIRQTNSPMSYKLNTILIYYTHSLYNILIEA